MGDIPAIVVMGAIPVSLVIGQAIRQLGEEVVRGSFAAKRGRAAAYTARPVVADDGEHRAPHRRRDHRSV